MHPSRSIAIISIVNASDPELPLVGGGRMAIRFATPDEPDLVVRLNGVVAQDVKPGFDADGFAALLVDLNASQPGPLTAGSLAVQVSRTTPDGMRSIAESQIVHTSIVPSFAAPLTIENRQLGASMTLPVPPGSVAAALLFPRGAPSLPSRRIPCATRAAPSTELVAPLAGVPAGKYLVSVEIDGVATLLEFSGEAYTGPVVDIPAV